MGWGGGGAYRYDRNDDQSGETCLLLSIMTFYNYKYLVAGFFRRAKFPRNQDHQVDIYLPSASFYRKCSQQRLHVVKYSFGRTPIGGSHSQSGRSSGLARAR